MSTYYPVFLDVKGRRCLVIGGGDVAERKVKALLECGASVTVISPEVTPGVEELARGGRVQWERRRYRVGDLEGAFLAIAGTDDASVNREVAWEARGHNVLLNVVDMPSLCTFVAPAIVKRGQVTIAISTGGASPALARRLREELERSSLLDWAEAAPMLSQARQELRARGLQVPPEHWQECMTAEVLQLVREGKQQEAKDKLLAALSVGVGKR